MLMPIVVNADTIEIDGIFYNLITKGDIGEVVSNPDHYSGSIVIPTSVSYEGKEYKITTINGGAFRSCQELTSITIPNSITSIGGSAFQNCTGLTSITIPESVKIIDRDTFYDCKNLVTVNLPDNLTIIGSSSFVGCTSLTSIALPDSLTTINGSAFYGCTSLSSVTFGKNLESIGVESFGNCPLLTSIHISDLEAWLNVKFYDLFRTPYHLFLNGTEIKDLVIPDGIKDLKNPSFSRCIGLTSVTIPNSVETIGDGTFSGTGLTSIVLPNSVTEIRTAFSGCKELSSVVLGNNVRWVGASAFAGCVKLEKVYCYSEVVPNTEANAFDGSYPQFVTLYVPKASISSYKARVPWSNFKEIKAIDSEPSLGLKRTIHVAQAGTLSDYISEDERYQIEELTLTGEINGKDFMTIRDMFGANVELDDNYFEMNYVMKNEDAKLRSLDISEVRIVAGGHYLYNHKEPACDLHLEESDIIPDRVFDGCKYLVSITIPDNVNYIGCFALRGTAWYDAQPDGLVYLGKVLYAYKGDDIPSKITIKNGTLGIAGNAFADLPIESVTIPESVTRIGGSEKERWGDLSHGFRPLGKGAFAGCTELKDVYCYAENLPDTNLSAFWGTNIESVNLYVPAGSIASYKAVEPWSLFKEIVAITQEIVKEEVVYEIEGGHAQVINSGNASGDVKIEAFVVVDDKEYEVTVIAKDAFKGCTEMLSAELPNTITSIGESAFEGCTRLKYFEVGNGIMEILSRAFANIASSSTSTRGGNDEGLHFYCLANAVPNTAADAFEGTDIANAKLHVPENLVEQYKVSAPWSGFGTIVGLSGTGITEISKDAQDGVIYNLNGNRLKVMSKGINLIHQKDGRVIKVLKK